VMVWVVVAIASRPPVASRSSESTAEATGS
jgi:hypothetical protein